MLYSAIDYRLSITIEEVFGMRKKYWGLALAVLTGVLAGALGGGAKSGMVVFMPFIAIADGMRALSLASGTGDACAWALYALLSLAPLSALLPRGRKRGWADALACVTAAYGFLYWYAMANPSSFMPSAFGEAEGMAEILRYMFTVMLLALYFGMAAFRLTEEDGGSMRMLSRLRVALYCVSLLICVVNAAAVVLIMRAAVIAGGADVAYALAQCACSLAVAAAMVLTLEGARALLSGMREGWFAEGNAAKAVQLSKRARLLLTVTIISELMQNGLALMMLGRVADAKITYDMPVLEFVLACALILLARFVRDGVKLKRENETFI